MAGTSAGVWQARGWNWPNAGYIESHDEQRIAHDLLLYGNASGGYDTKALSTAMDRLAMAHAFLFTLPGPKMMYQWGEFGYDVSIYDCLNGNFAEGCKLDEKPEPWDDRALVPERQGLGAQGEGPVRPQAGRSRRLGPTTTALISAGRANAFNLYSPDQNVVLCGNFDVVGFDMVPGFPHTGVWTDAITGDTHNVTDLAAPSTFAPGQWNLWMDTPVTPVDDAEPLSLVSTCADQNALNFGAGRPL